MSDDGQHALTCIAMLGSVFSPFYAKARARGPAHALEHCSMNVALYSRLGHLWAMTERSSGSVSREKHALTIGPSSLERRGCDLLLHIDEMTSPFPSPFPERLAGSIHVSTEGFGLQGFALDEPGRHQWTPLAPCSRAEVRLTHPSLRFRGHAYVDMNSGAEPLENAFSHWSWARASSGREACITYDITRLDGSRRLIAKRTGASGQLEDLPPLSHAGLGWTKWGLQRDLLIDSGTRPTLLRTLEDTPFYARSLARAQIGGLPGTLVHEALSLKRFKTPWVQFLLPYRMKRALV